MESDKKDIDRTTRLVITLTIFGGSWFLLRGAFALWFNTFSKSAYIKSLFTIEYVISVIVLTFIIVTSIRVLSYVFTELKTFQVFSSIDDKVDMQKIADAKYAEIFKTIKRSINGIIGISIISLIVELTIKPSLLISITIGTVLFLVLFIILRFFVKKEKLKGIISKVDGIEQKISPYVFLLYTGLIVFLVGISLALMSINHNRYIEVEFKKTNELELEIVIQNIDDPEMVISIVNENKPDKRSTIKVTKDDYYHDLVEVFEHLNTQNTKYNIDKYIKHYHYSTNLDQYVLDGRNIVEINIIGKDSNVNKVTRIVNEIERNGSRTKIAEDKFMVKP